jgi:rfaE bifunctional protein nucleotidyltransferase chain/domain
MNDSPMSLISLEAFQPERERISREGRILVFTNGCFDLLHPGHLCLLEQAKSAGDLLIVGLNSDISVRLIKGDKRPIMNQIDRTRLLSALKPVDYVVLFDEPTPLRTIEAICPDVLVKGSDWAPDKIVGADFVQKNGGKVLRVDLVAGQSTSGIIEDILRKYKQGA